MKKLLCLLLAICTLPLAACGSNGGAPAANTTAPPAQEATLLVGYGAQDITPQESVPMGGYGKSTSRMSTGFASYLMATCVAVTDPDGNTLLLYGLDLIATSALVPMIPAISRATGVPEDNICLSASHNHSCADLGETSVPSIVRYKATLEQALVKAGKKAMEDRAPAKMYGATVETEGLNFIRRYVMNDGSYAGPNFGDWSSGIKDYESEVDNDLQLLKFEREGKDIILANFQCHPHRGTSSSETTLYADLVGEFRDALSKELDCHVVYFTGPSGNINATSRIEEDNIYDSSAAHGKALARYALKAEYTPITGTQIRVQTYTYTATINHEDNAWANLGRELHKKWESGQITTAQLKKMSAEAGYPMNSPYHANAIYARSTMGKTLNIPIAAYSIGSLGFAVVPYEMFDTSGMFIKENAPQEMTFIATCANGGYGYLPTLLAFEHGGYSVDTTKYVAGTAEELADQYLQLFTQLQAGK